MMRCLEIQCVKCSDTLMNDALSSAEQKISREATHTVHHGVDIHNKTLLQRSTASSHRLFQGAASCMRF
jgi:hypothetical protein